MDEKARFQIIQSQLERYLYEYKNSFPKNIWQMIGVDLPFVILIVSLFVVVRLLGFGLMAIVLIALMLLPYILMWSTQTNSIWSKLWKKRKTYRADNQAIINKINEIDTSEFEQYPDVKRYLENFQSELADETLRKESIAKSHKKIMIIGSLIILAGALLTFTTETRLKLFNPNIVDKQEKPKSDIIQNVFYDGQFYNTLKLTPKEPVAVVEPLNSATKQMTDNHNKTLKIFFREFSGSAHYLRIKTPKISNYTWLRYEKFRLYITDTLGHPVKNIPYFEFKYVKHGTNPPIIESYPIATGLEKHPYEIIRRVKYLQDNAKILRYVIEGIEK
ncbi:MAG: hypothetical protein J5826_04020 [Bacteroidales bacterium]|nr:hypothetical protein [Bacteroidales bacterium]